MAAILLLAVAAGCDRNVEPYVPGEEPRQPDLSKIFPAGAEQAERGPIEMPPAPTPEGGRGADPFAGAAPIRGTVRVAPDLAGRLPQGGVLFVIARPGASGPPLAVKRVSSPSFPLQFSLGPEDRMIRTMPFSGELLLTARLDADGDATSRAPGDLQGRAAGAHAPGASGVEIVLDEVL